MLSTYMDGELAAQDQQRVEAHLAYCHACAEDLRTLRYTRALLVKAPAPRIPRSFVVRRADLEEGPDTAPRRAFRPGSRLVYGYLRGATAVVTMAFVLLVAGDLIGQFGLGARQPVLAPAEEAVVEKAVAVEHTQVPQLQVEQEPITVESALPAEVEKVVVPAATPSPAARQVSPTPEPAALDKEREIESLAVPEVAPTQVPAAAASPPTEGTATEKAYGTDAILSPAAQLTVMPPSPTALPSTPTGRPSVTPEPTRTALQRRGRPWLTAIRGAEIGLGTLALALLIVTLVARRQRF
jgi:hypothetical protein